MPIRLPAFVLLMTAAGAAANPAPAMTWFDAATARELIDARREFDAAELRAIAAFDRAIGGEPRRVAVPVQQYRDQVASPALREIQWSEEVLVALRARVQASHRDGDVSQLTATRLG